MDRDDVLLDYLQGRLAPGERVRLEAEMAADPALAAELEVMRAVRAALADDPRHAQAEAVWDRLSATMEPPLRAANRNRPDWRAIARHAAVAAAAVLLWQAVVAPYFSVETPGYRTASEQDPGFVLQLRFADGASMGQVAALLSDLDGTITGGPGALGLLRVSFPDEARRATALNTLRAAALVEFVQTP